jgi:molecular chaperone GrpE
MNDEKTEHLSDTSDQASSQDTPHDVDDITIESYNDDLDSGEPITKDIVKRLRAETKKLTQEKQEYLDGWQRSKADFANYKKRETEEKLDFTRFAKEGMVIDLIPVIESFQLAFKNTEAWNKVEANWRIGVEYIYQQLLRAMNDHGLITVNPLGKLFDPNIHHSVGSISTSEKDKEHIIAEVVSEGFELNGKIIKSASVKVFEYDSSKA